MTIFESCEYLTKLLARYAYVEMNYRDRRLDESPRLEETTIGVCTSVLKYTAAIKEAGKAKAFREFKKLKDSIQLKEAEQEL
jgi:hypothetical protein